MIENAFKALDHWMVEANESRKRDGALWPDKAEFKILGQTALIESRLELHLVATQDVDAYVKAQYEVCKKLDELLKVDGKHLDPDWRQIWMPEETEYKEIYTGKFVTAWIAKPEYVLISKALKAPEKNSALIVEYLAKGPSKKFETLAKKYKVNLEQFV